MMALERFQEPSTPVSTRPDRGEQAVLLDRCLVTVPA
jgi:hypothetical protein